MMLCFQTTVLEVGDGCILMMPKVNKKSSFVWVGKRRRLASLTIEPGRFAIPAMLFLQCQCLGYSAGKLDGLTTIMLAGTSAFWNFQV